MKEQLVSFETAKLAKEKGFDWPVLFMHATFNDKYSEKDRLQGYSGSDIPAKNWNASKKEEGVEEVELFSAPTQSLLQKWLREKHQIYAEVGVDQTCEPKFAPEAFCFFGNPENLGQKEWGWKQIFIKEWYLYRTYEEAFENVLYEVLKTIK